ncbi:hypothetical protein [Bacillus sp. ISL-45]|uniref:hypothetical protein n=1 Tax=Bacillus sp. ISL-45 TaxID=2819128 RepID=UPI001BED023B|nr:hypothetical protein [Bacillus sp. ISL-45]MBT2659756.1 hypothetical protein [Bacillus sp. ISL-45]
MEANELLQPSLDQEWKKTKTYDINRLFLVAFFGGTIPTITLGTRNAKWLNVPDKTIHLLIGAGILFTIADIVFITLFFQGFFAPESKPLLKFGFKLLAIILFFMYRKVMTKPFEFHLMTNGEITPIFKPAILWMLSGAVIQGILLFAAFAISEL